MRTLFRKPFARFVKKSKRPLQLAIEDAVEEVRRNPRIGDPKKGDLAGMSVYKFRFNRQEYLLAYRYDPAHGNQDGDELPVIVFFLVGTHENFYEALKRYLREE